MQLCREIEIKAGLTAKVSTLRLKGERNFRLLRALGKAFSGHETPTVVFASNAEDIVETLRENLLENHTSDEVEVILDELRFGTSPETPFGKCIFALFDIDGPKRDLDQQPE